MSTRSTRSGTVVEGVRAAGRWSDAAAAACIPRHVASPHVTHLQEDRPGGSIHEAPTCDTPFRDTYTRVSDNLKGTVLGDPGLSDSFEDRESDTTQDSDSGSFYSVQSHRTYRGADSPTSLQSGSFSESTLYDSAQSLHTISPSPPTVLGFAPHLFTTTEDREHRRHANSLSFQPGHTHNFGEVLSSDIPDEYTSCPDFSSLGHRFPTRLARALIGSASSNTMSTLDEATAPKSPRSPRDAEEGEKKKKGLISSFRKNRKTGRKLRQQKKTSEGDDVSTSTGANSDGEGCDSEASAPNSPSCVKSEAVARHGDGEEPTVVLDSHQSAHERLNGSAPPKGPAPGSKTPSPTPIKSTRVEEGSKKAEEKEEKKREKSKFGSFLRKEKKQKTDSALKTSLVSSNSAGSSQNTDASQASGDGVSTSDVTDHKQEKEEPVKNDAEQTTAGGELSRQSQDGAQAPRDTATPTEAPSSSFRSYMSNVQLVKNWNVGVNVSKNKEAAETKTKPSADTAVADKKMGEDTVDVKKSVAGLKPVTTEPNSSLEKREHLYKILVIGELGTGKTSIIKRYVHQFFSQHYRATIGVDFALKVLSWDNNTVIRLQLWDIAGQERFGNMTRVYYKEAVGAFVVFDVTRAQTFDAVTKWKTDLDTKVTLADGSTIPTVLLANKCDQPKEGVVNNPARMDDFCRERGFSGWFETSAKENINIDEASRFLVNRILSNEKQGMMLSESMDTEKFSVDGKAIPVDKSGCRC